MAHSVPRVRCRISQTRRAKWGPREHVASPNWMEIQSKWIKRIRCNLSTNGGLICGNEDKKEINEKRKEHFLFFLGMESGKGGKIRF